MHQESQQAARELGVLLLRRRLSLAAAESCTGGWLAKLVTDIPGSSGWFERGFVTYSNTAKVEMLGVSERTLREQGAVSAATVNEMA
ncbi:MAG: nicotinamide-nucleotide amidohydrolase family protein, partial [Nevskiales bacterium]